MIFRIFFLFLFLAGTFLTVSAQDDFPYKRYVPRTLAELDEMNMNVLKTDPNIKIPKLGIPLFDSDFLFSHVRVKFMNRSRPISLERKGLIYLWRQFSEVDEKIIASFENEYLFKECNTEYWLPVQKPVAAYFPRDLKEGDMVTLYLMRANAKKDNAAWTWIYLVNEFDK